MYKINFIKKNLVINFLLLVFTLFVLGCEDNGGGDPPAPDPEPKISASEVIQLSNTENGYHPKYSPDGSKIAFTVRNNNYMSMLIFDRQTGTSYTLLSNIEGDMSLNWSPDSKKIAYDAYAPNGVSQIWIKNIETGNLEQLTNLGYPCFQPEWTGDGSRIMFVGGGNIKMMNLSTGTVSQISNTTGCWTPALAPDDSRIVYSFATNGLNISDLFIINSDGTEKTQITNYSDRDDRARWSPDGKFIVYEKYSGNDPFLAVYECGNGVKTQLQIDGIGGMPDWSPDGNSIVFVRNQSLWEVGLIYTD